MGRRIKRIKGFHVICAACLGALLAGVFGCEMTTGNTGSGDTATIREMERSIVDLEKKLSDLTREVAEINERTVRSEKALDAYLTGAARKPVEEETIDRPVNDVPGPGTAAAPPDGAAPVPSHGEDSPAVVGPVGEPAVSPAGGGPKDAQALYDRALSEVMDRKAETALPLFVEFVKTYPSDELTDNASYWIGECYYLMSDYQKAIDQFKGVTERFPGKDKAPDALLKIGFCYEKIGDPARARETFSSVVTTFPDSSAADLAREKLK
jgi:tol-pal system protein YbgF